MLFRLFAAWCTSTMLLAKWSVVQSFSPSSSFLPSSALFRRRSLSGSNEDFAHRRSFGSSTTCRPAASNKEHVPEKSHPEDTFDNDSSMEATRRDFLRQVPRTAVSVASSTAAAALVMGGSSPPSLALEEAEAGVSAAAAATEETVAMAPSPRTTTLQLPPMGLGAWAWGDSLFWGYDAKNDADLRQVFDYAVSNNNVTLIDTAEIYGFGRSESLIGQFAQSYPPNKIQVATKFAAVPFRTQPQDVVKACQASLKRLQRSSIDLYQIHFPGAWNNAEYWDGLAMAYEQGLVQAVGVSNYGVDAIRACHAALSKRGIPLSTNQIQLSLLYQYPVENGLLQACKDLGIQVLSYSPLALGMLTGKYTPESPPGGPRKAVYDKLLSTPDYNNLLAIMTDIAAIRPSATLSQVALNWARAKQTIPIPGARTLSQIEQNYQSLAWDLSPEEVRALDVAASKVKTFITPEQGIFPKEDRNTHLKMFDS